MSDEETRNVFDQNKGDPVDLVVYTGGERKIVGKAYVTHDDTGINVVAHFDDKDNGLFEEFSVGGISIANRGIDTEENNVPHTTYHRPGEKKAPVNDDTIKLSEHTHIPIDHGDGKQKWCNICGLTSGFLKPQPRRSSTN